MGIAWGIVVVTLSLLCWGGQTVSWLSPVTAARLGVAEAEDAVEPTFWADIRGEALWDAFTLWTLVVAGVLLIADVAAWAYFGLVGGGMYVYFAGRGILARAEMQRRGLRAGTAQDLRAAYIMLPIWGVVGIVTIFAAVGALSS